MCQASCLTCAISFRSQPTYEEDTLCHPPLCVGEAARAVRPLSCRYWGIIHLVLMRWCLLEQFGSPAGLGGPQWGAGGKQGGSAELCTSSASVCPRACCPVGTWDAWFETMSGEFHLLKSGWARATSEGCSVMSWLSATPWTIQLWNSPGQNTRVWVAFPFSRGSSQSRDLTQVSCIAAGFFTSWATRESHQT